MYDEVNKFAFAFHKYLFSNLIVFVYLTNYGVKLSELKCTNANVFHLRIIDFSIQ